MIKLNDVIIFRAGENPNGIFITEDAINDLEKFKNKPIVNKIYGTRDYWECESDKENVIGVILEATRIEFPYVYGNIAIFEDEFDKLNTMKNYEIQLDLGEKEEGNILRVNEFDLMAIEME